MKTPETLRQEALAWKTSKLEEDEVVAEILRIKDTLEARHIDKWQGDPLSRAVARLSILLVNLGQMVTEAELVANSSYIYRKWKRAGQIGRLTKTVGITQAKEQAEKAVSEELESEILSRYQADILKALYSDTERLVSVIQTRLGILRNEEIRSRGTG